MTEAAASAKKKIQIAVEEGGVADVTINGAKVAEISPDGNVTTFTDKGTQLAKPAAVAETAAKDGVSIELNKAFNTVAMFGATVELATDGSLIVSTNGKVFTKAAPANDTATSVEALKVGTRMEDGTIFAGISRDTNKPMYAAPADESLTLSFDKAKERAEQKSQETGKAYRVPSQSELNVLFNNRAAIGGFNLTGSGPSGWYWSSTPYDNDVGRCQRLSDGKQGNGFRDNGLSVRLVRS